MAETDLDAQADLQPIERRGDNADKRPGCSHDGCDEIMPRGPLVPPGWTSARVEEHSKDSIRIYMIHLCPSHKLASVPRQEEMMFEEAAP